MRQSLTVAALCAVMISAIGCGESFAGPGSLDGSWAGTLGGRLGEVELLLEDVGGIVEGSFRLGDIEGRVSGNRSQLILDAEPATSTCASIGMTIEDRSASRIRGRTGGRCYGTVSGKFDLRRY